MPMYEEECRECHRVAERYDAMPNAKTWPCPKCGGETERVYSIMVPRIFRTFSTRNIMEDGREVTVRGTGQLRQLESEHGVKMVDGGPPPQTRFPEPS